MKPLEDVRIVAVEQYGAGPFGTVHLADLGAEVIKVEDPRTGGDVGRYVPPYQEAEDSLFFETFNRNKRSLSLDLSTDRGQEVFHDLVRVSDAVFSNLRGDIPERLGLRYEDLRMHNPTIVCCSLSGFGMTGPRRTEPAYDYMLQGIAGWMSLTGNPDGPPQKSGLSLVDFTGGYVAALATVIGIHAARRDGEGMDCDVSLFEVAMGMLTYPATWHLSQGFRPQRTQGSAHPSLVPFQNFATADGWIVVACAKEKFWQRLCTAIGRGDLADDPRFATFAERRAHRAHLVAILEEVFTTATSDEWIDRLGDGGVPCAPVNTVEEALVDPQVAARKLVVESAHDRFGTVRQLASPVNVGKQPRAHRRAPQRHEDADHVLHDVLGYTEHHRQRLTEGMAFG